MNKNQISLIIYKVLNDFIVNFKKNPYAYLYESDIQAELFVKLRKEIPGTIKIPNEKKLKEFYEINLVNTEYKSKIDIVCLDPDSIPSTIHLSKNFNNTIIYKLPVFAGIELKYRKMGDKSNISKMHNDYLKLKNNLRIEMPIVIGFIQEENYVNSYLEPKDEFEKIDISEINSQFNMFIVSPKKLYGVRKRGKNGDRLDFI